MSPSSQDPLSRREREMMDIVFRLRRATAAQVMAEMAAPPSYSAVRATLRVLENKGHLVHEHEGNRYVYRPAVRTDRARRAAVDHLLETFFGGSPERLVAALLERPRHELDREELERLSRLIDKAREEGR